MYEKLFSLPAWREAPVICGYVSVRGELNTDPILRRAAAEGKTVALPVTVTGAAEGRMVFRALPNGDLSRLTPARFGIPEPDESCPSLTGKDLTHALILIPALAFDENGYRLGYGGGYYDRFLSFLREAEIPHTTVGLTYAVCRATALPREAHDIPVHIILDERSTTIPHGS
jgi:5-formyltetrahydrofolate cyclo-ligase